MANKYADHSKWKESKGCIRKRKYTKEEAAQKVASILKGKGDAYRCPYCREWHITSRISAAR